MISKKLLVLQRLTAHLEGINFTSAYSPDPVSLTGRVYRGRTVFGDEVTLPFLALLEAPRQLTPDNAGEQKLVRKDLWGLLVQGFAADNGVHPTDPAYELCAYVEQRMSRLVEQRPDGAGYRYPEEARLGGLIESISFQNPIVRPPDNDVSATAYLYMPVTVELVTNMVLPFAEE